MRAASKGPGRKKLSVEAEVASEEEAEDVSLKEVPEKRRSMSTGHDIKSAAR